MASEDSHIAVANRNHAALTHLCADVNKFGPWVVTVAFYKALHVVEAVFANDRDIGHTHDHGDRELRLKRTRKYENIYKHYAPMMRASLVARYLEHGSTAVSSFYEYMKPEQIGPEILFH